MWFYKESWRDSTIWLFLTTTTAWYLSRDDDKYFIIEMRTNIEENWNVIFRYMRPKKMWMRWIQYILLQAEQWTDRVYEAPDWTNWKKWKKIYFYNIYHFSWWKLVSFQLEYFEFHQSVTKSNKIQNTFDELTICKRRYHYNPSGKNARYIEYEPWYHE